MVNIQAVIADARCVETTRDGQIHNPAETHRDSDPEIVAFTWNHSEIRASYNSHTTVAS